jgi:hypothetical protein
MVLELLAGE